MTNPARVAWLLPLALGACNLAPAYHRPDLAAPAAFKEKPPPGWLVSSPGDTAPKGQWWRGFGDATLDQLEQKLGTANQNVKAALARLDEARAMSEQAEAAFYPTVDANVLSDRNRISVNGIQYNPLDPKKYYSDHSMSLNLSYELDVFGRVRNQAASAQASEQASLGDAVSLTLREQADLAADYFTLRGADIRQQWQDQIVDTDRKAAELTHNRFEDHIASAIDVAQADSALESARLEAEDLRLSRMTTEHAIAVLIGVPPANFSLPVRLDPLPALQPISAGLPSTLMQRRPDIAAAERRVLAANADIGVARAAYYPDFSLNAMAGLEAVKPSKWITAQSQMWTLGGSVAQTIFDGGRIAGLNAEARAKYSETAANYRQTVLTAYQEVEDQLATLRQLQREITTTDASAADAEHVLNLSMNRYHDGIYGYLQVVTARTSALEMRDAAAALRVRDISAYVLLVRALGGGWQSDWQKS